VTDVVELMLGEVVEDFEPWVLCVTSDVELMLGEVVEDSEAWVLCVTSCVELMLGEVDKDSEAWVLCVTSDVELMLGEVVTDSELVIEGLVETDRLLEVDAVIKVVEESEAWRDSELEELYDTRGDILTVVEDECDTDGVCVVVDVSDID